MGICNAAHVAQGLNATFDCFGAQHFHVAATFTESRIVFFASNYFKSRRTNFRDNHMNAVGADIDCGNDSWRKDHGVTMVQMGMLTLMNVTVVA